VTGDELGHLLVLDVDRLRDARYAERPGREARVRPLRLPAAEQLVDLRRDRGGLKVSDDRELGRRDADVVPVKRLDVVDPDLLDLGDLLYRARRVARVGLRHFAES